MEEPAPQLQEGLEEWVSGFYFSEVGFKHRFPMSEKALQKFLGSKLWWIFFFFLLFIEFLENKEQLKEKKIITHILR